MKFLGWLKRATIVVSILAILLISVGPWALYWFALSGVEGSPSLPTSSTSQSEKQKIWQQMRGTGEPNVSAITPHEYFFLVSSVTNHSNKNAGVLLAWQVASNYNLDHLEYEGMGWWHFSGVALTIWLTRNWTTEQLLSKVAENHKSNADSLQR